MRNRVSATSRDRIADGFRPKTAGVQLFRPRDRRAGVKVDRAKH